ncbi:aspartate/glutamate racemase family protein [Kiloniella majae]|uniref:aspartate/glutamate racemase family protein n=1 Tax=Kiloniella majae TaxID=1938558 RepID=UPI000A2783FC|nr:aspartate/glutamate racemase family protein [Kiloniella majae]
MPQIQINTTQTADTYDKSPSKKRTPGDRNIYGVSIGVICLESYFPKPPGHIKNPSGLSFPVLYHTIKGATVQKLINAPDDDLRDLFITAAKDLVREGARAITSSCGFSALYQTELAAAVDVPVFASSLIQIPLVWNMTGCKAPVGVLTANSKGLTPAHFAAVGATDIPVEIQGMEDQPEFSTVILKNQRTDMDLQRIEDEVLDAARKLLARAPNIKSLVLECTDMPPYAYRIQEETALPVFDLTTLATMAHNATTPLRYKDRFPD